MKVPEFREYLFCGDAGVCDVRRLCLPTRRTPSGPAIGPASISCTPRPPAYRPPPVSSVISGLHASVSYVTGGDMDDRKGFPSGGDGGYSFGLEGALRPRGTGESRYGEGAANRCCNPEDDESCESLYWSERRR